MSIQNTGTGVIVAAFIVISLIIFALKNRSDKMQRAKYERLISDNYLAKVSALMNEDSWMVSSMSMGHL